MQRRRSAPVRRRSFTMRPKEPPQPTIPEAPRARLRRTLSEMSSLRTLAGSYALRKAAILKPLAEEAEDVAAPPATKPWRRQKVASGEADEDEDANDGQPKVIRKGHLHEFEDGNWSRLFFVLDASSLRCYHSEKLFVQRQRPMTHVELETGWRTRLGGLRNENSNEAGFPFQLFLEGRKRPLRVFAAESSTQRKQWARDLQDTAKKLEAGSSRELPAELKDVAPVFREYKVSHMSLQQHPSEALSVIKFISAEEPLHAPLEDQHNAKLQSIVDTHFRDDDPNLAYEMLSVCSRGAMGTVYLARRAGTDSEVNLAVRVVPIANEDERQALLSSVALGYVSRGHPNLIDIVDTFAFDDMVWVVLEYVNGHSLETILANNGRLVEQHIAYVARCVLRALVHLHEKGRVHKELTSANVLFGLDGSVHVAERGVGAMLKQSEARLPVFIAPEVITTMQPDQRSDIWSFGILLLEMAERNPPYLKKTYVDMLHNVLAQPAPTLKRPSEWSPAFQSFLSAALQKDPVKRASAVSLLKHPFLRTTASPQSFAKVVTRSRLVQERLSRFE